ncbi:hypothetical protein DEAC_c30290 [Desulfosporosinus acididurans]|uniref:FlgN protein n=1 Tax=Desulfosporosinus acididurans TaxID=476652 RepID=A0A0J1FP28_9FIRM|nr:hypothetical protein [Desulfosporosinus acididurans]KLU65062.1 hypothetical protein DEAC_c30290 [Desulfosporosinus acididurans]
MINKEVSNLCEAIYEKMTLNLEAFEEMLKITQHLEMKSPDDEAELFIKMFEQRQDLINKIEIVNKEVTMIGNQIINVLNFGNFELESIKPYISHDLYQNLTTTNANINKVIVQIQAFDKQYKEQAEMVRERTKSQIIRFKTTQLQNQLYQKMRSAEPKFVDKNG